MREFLSLISSSNSTKGEETRLTERLAGPEKTRAQCAHRHGPTAQDVLESASYGDAVVSAAAAAAVVSGAAVVGGSPTPDSMLKLHTTRELLSDPQ